jgi:23S rRNA (cytosine1962-C5)-methyltransferase
MQHRIATAYLKPSREKSLLRRHPWIFSGAIERVDGDPEPGATIAVASSRDEFLAYAAWSPRSQIRARVWSFDMDTAIDEAFLAARLAAAIDARRALGLLDTGACRVVFSESDGLPGLIVDRYGDFLSCQFLSTGAEFWRGEIIAQLMQLLSPRGIYDRSDVSVRRKEGLAQTSGVIAGDAPPAALEIEIDGLVQTVDLAHGQKTGSYLDQRVNRLRVANYARDRQVLDAYAYTGGFGLACLHAGAASATFIDSSSTALTGLNAAAARNGLAERCETIQADVPEQLREFVRSDRRFDLIVLDPPKFVNAAEQVTKGCRAYKDINRLALELLNPGGLLATFSCSGHVDAVLLQQVLAQAAVDAGRDPTIIERLSQPPDHPVALPFPESEYLKGFVLRV